MFYSFATFSSTGVFENVLEDFGVDLEGELLDRFLFSVELKVDYEFLFGEPYPRNFLFGEADPSSLASLVLQRLL